MLKYINVNQFLIQVMLNTPFWFRLIVSNLLLFSFISTVQADTHSTLKIDEDIAIDILQIGPSSPVSIIWFTCNQGDETAEVITARKLATQGYQLFFPDMLSTHFLSPTPSNITSVSTVEISRVIQYILNKTESAQVYLVGGARAAVPVLKGLSDDTIKKTGSKLKAALLITPRINSKTPEPGAEPKYIEEAGLSTHPIMILEGERTPNRWGLPHLSKTLARSGSSIHTNIIKGVRGFFYLRTEKTVEEVEMTRQLDQLIHTNIEKLRTIKP